ncbi:MAG TPA: hypothetical protein VFD95_03440 [Usitatibacter sp.]|jgi:uncharacterized membrane protein|nr:hypothetical protein [Usitatibacter sp.]
MATIIAGGFETIVEAQDALQHLSQAGVNSEYICEFRVNPPGMHDTTAVGGDRDESPGAHEADSGAVKGASVGAVVGAVAGVALTPLMGPAGIAAGAGVGGYTGSLVGGMKGGVDHEAQPDHTVVRPAEAMVAVNVDGAGIAEEEIVRIFEQAGAWQIERSEGLWEEGEWKDFDAVSPPHLIGGRDPQAGAGRAA